MKDPQLDEPAGWDHHDQHLGIVPLGFYGDLADELLRQVQPTLYRSLFDTRIDRSKPGGIKQGRNSRREVWIRCSMLVQESLGLLNDDL